MRADCSLSYRFSPSPSPAASVICTYPPLPHQSPFPRFAGAALLAAANKVAPAALRSVLPHRAGVVALAHTPAGQAAPTAVAVWSPPGALAAAYTGAVTSAIKVR